MSGPRTCPVCGSDATEEFLDLQRVPTQDGILWRTTGEAEAAPTGDIRLTLCADCSYVWNPLHDPAKVSFIGYDVSLQHSLAFRTFVDGLAAGLVERHALRHKTVLDIGCGRGHFLETICELGDNDGVGFDPSYSPPDGPSPTHRRLRFHRAYYGRDRITPANLISSRHVLDVLGDQAGFLRLVADTAAESPSDAVVYLEVPHAMATFDTATLWNVVYEHRSWFVEESLTQLLAQCGMETLRAERCWEDEYLGIEARLAPRGSARPEPVDADSSGIAAAIDRFVGQVDGLRAQWGERMSNAHSDGRRVAIWGAGARAVAFLTLCHTAASAVPYAVDVNPARQGLYLPRTATQVHDPEHLLVDPPDVVLVSNPTYRDEIQRAATALGVSAELWTL